MRIVAVGKDGTEIAAKAIDGVFKCYPPSENRNEYAVTFDAIEDAAIFLILKSDWGIRMDGGSPIKYRGISILRDR